MKASWAFLRQQCHGKAVLLGNFAVLPHIFTVMEQGKGKGSAETILVGTLEADKLIAAIVGAFMEKLDTVVTESPEESIEESMRRLKEVSTRAERRSNEAQRTFKRRLEGLEQVMNNQRAAFRRIGRLQLACLESSMLESVPQQSEGLVEAAP